MPKNKFIEKIEKHPAEILRFGVRKLGVFGSCIRNEERPESDVDLLVEFEPESRKLINLVNLGEFLEELFGRQVELVTPESLSPYMGPGILKEVQYATLAA